MHSGYQKTPPEVHRQPWLDMVGRVPMSACAGQRLSGEASGWVRWSSSRTGWNHGLGCSHGVESSQPGQQGGMVQLVSTISSTVALSVSAARTKAPVARKSSSESSQRRKSNMRTASGHVSLLWDLAHGHAPRGHRCLRVRSNLLKLWAVPRPVLYPRGRGILAPDASPAQ